MKKAMIVFLFIFLIFGIYAQNIYIGGSYSDEINLSGKGRKACYWKNGVQYEIDGVSIDAITVYKTSVYIAGVYRENICRYWIDGKPYELPDCLRVYKIHVDNFDVYVVGDNERNKTCYWKNGVQQNGPSDGIFYPKCFTVINGIVYIAGSFDKGIDFYTCYWVDNIRYELSNSKNFSPCGIEVVGNQIYIGANNFQSQACYWIDNKQHIFSNTDGLPIDVFKVYNSNIYMVSNKYYFINGIRREYNIEGYIYNIVSKQAYFVNRGNVYIAGWYFYQNQNKVRAGYWIDGVHHILDGKGRYFNIETIFVYE